MHKSAKVGEEWPLLLPPTHRGPVMTE